MNRSRTWLVGLLITSSLIFSGCATNSTKRTSASHKDYEYVYITGSNLRIKVRKGERPVYKGTAPIGTMDTTEVHDSFEVPKGVVNPGS